MTSNASAVLYRERLASLLPVIDAFIANKPIQWRSKDCYPWVDHIGDYPNFFQDNCLWRVKPELRNVWVHRGHYHTGWKTALWANYPDQRVLFARPDFNEGEYIMFREVPK